MSGDLYRSSWNGRNPRLFRFAHLMDVGGFRLQREMLEKWVHKYAEGVPTIVAVECDALVVYSTDITPDQSFRQLMVGKLWAVTQRVERNDVHNASEPREVRGIAGVS